jgi:hypothetical protein
MLIDPPGRYAPLEEWEKHLAMVKTLKPRGTWTPRWEIVTAERRVAELKGKRLPEHPSLAWLRERFPKPA